MKKSSAILLLVILSGICFGGVGFLSTRPEKKVGAHSLPEVYCRVDEALAFGSMPKGRADLQGLYDRGIRVVVSVDGAPPLVEDARAVGLKVIHVPTRYSGIDEHAAAALKRISEENKKSIYVHCHHGKYRGPAAAVVVGMCKGLFSKKRALEIMAKAGAGNEYRGLRQSVRDFDPEARSSEIPELMEVQSADRIVEQMVIADESLDRLKAYLSAGQIHVGSHADVSHELLLMREAMAESRRFSDSDVKDLIERFTGMENQVRQIDRSTQAEMSQFFSDDLQKLEKDCKGCHRAHRN